MSNKAIDSIRRRPVISSFITLGALAAAFTAFAQFTNVIDLQVVSHKEMAQVFEIHNSKPHKLAQDQIDILRKESTCNTIDIQIAILTELIWRLEQENPNGIRLVEKQNSLEKLKDRRTVLTCADLA